jgi:hypothetical protein
MANTLRFKRGLASGIPTALAGEPLFTTDTFDLYIGNGTTNTRFQKYIASGTTSQYIRGDGTLATFPSLTGFVPYTGATANVDLGTHTILAQNATISSSGSGNTATITHSSGSGIALNITKGGNGEGLYINKTSGSGNAATIIGTLNATTLVKSGGLSTEYLKADGSVSTLTNPITGTGTTNYLPKFTGATTLGNSLIWDNGTTIGINTTSVNSNEKLRIDGGRLVVLGGTDVYQLKLAYNNATAGFWLGSPSANALSFYNDAGTERARFDASGNLGLGVTPNAWDLGQRILQINSSSIGGTSSNLALAFNNYFNGTNSLYINNGFASFYNQTSGQHIWYNAPSGTAGNAITFTQAMTLFSTGNLVVNSTTDSGEKLQVTGTMKVTGASFIGGGLTVQQTSNTYSFTIAQSNALNAGWGMWADTSGNYSLSRYGGGSYSSPALIMTLSGVTTFSNTVTAAGFIPTGASVLTNGMYLPTTNTLGWSTNSTERMRLDASGNLGLGVTPSAWSVNWKALQIGNAGFWSWVTGGTGTWVTQNTYFDGTNYKYIAASAASMYVQGNNSAHSWHIAGSGSAGGNITFTQAMTLTAAGRLILGAGDSGELLQVNGTAKITGASSFGGDMTLTGALTFPSAYGINLRNASNNSTVSLYNSGGSGASIFAVNGAASFTGNITTTGQFLRINQNSDIYINAGYDTGYAGIQVASNHGLQFATNNITRMTLSSTGSLGIGVIPATKLEVFDSVTTQLRVRMSGQADMRIISDTGYGALSNESNMPLVFRTNATERMRIGSTGNLLIGTTTDSGEKLRVNGTILISNSTIFSYSGLDATGALCGTSSSHPFRLVTNNVERIQISATGLVTFTDNARFSNLKGVTFLQTGGSLLGSIGMDSGNQVTIDNNGFFGLSVGSNYNLLGGNTGIGTSTFGTSATRTFAVLNGTAPSTSPADTFQMYSNDISAGNAAPHFRTENGAVIKLYQQDNGVAAANFIAGIGSPVTTLDAFDGYTIGQVVKALRNAGILS